MTETSDLQLLSAVELVRRYGRGVSHAALYPSSSHFRFPGIDGLIGFQVITRCAAVYGDPICAPEHRDRLTDAFAAHCDANGWSIVYIAATSAMQGYARERGYGTVEFADALTANPQQDPEEGHKARHLRQNLNRTRRQGVKVHEYPGAATFDAGWLEARVEAACKDWQKSRRGAQTYLGNPLLFTNRQGRRWFIAERFGNVVGALSMLDVSSEEGCSLINFVFSSPAAPGHTNDLMVVTALKTLRDEGARTVSFGIAPRLELGSVDGFGGVSEFLTRRLYKLVVRATHLHGRTVFWEKFGMTCKEPLCLLIRPPHIGLRVVNALARALHFSVT